jgi:hypothetical protein
MSLSDQEFAEIQRYISAKSQELRAQGDPRSDGELFMFILQSEWDVFADPTAMQEFSDNEELAKLENQRDTLDAQRPALDAEIADRRSR